MLVDKSRVECLPVLSAWPRAPLAQLLTPIHRVNFVSHLDNVELSIKRDDLTGLAGGGKCDGRPGVMSRGQLRQYV